MIQNDWDDVLKIVFESEGFKKFYHFVEEEYKTKTIFPPQDYVFNALKLTPYKEVKVVIVGQDPYHGEGEAHGLSFSVQKGKKLPPSLKNIYKELESDLGILPYEEGDLTKWAKQGVLMLNAVLTVVKDTPASHRNLGWERLTDYIIRVLNEKEEPVVFILWGNFAKEKKVLITNPQHLVLTSAHPSPFSANYGFFGSKPFSKTNEFLEKKGLQPIDWDLRNK
ncbi:MAG: uracil-DNA glycosylase [Bacilli bacterium]|nr:uracil-DNA glycosylase [Bacilli bacterium]